MEYQLGDTGPRFSSSRNQTPHPAYAKTDASQPFSPLGRPLGEMLKDLRIFAWNIICFICLVSSRLELQYSSRFRQLEFFFWISSGNAIAFCENVNRILRILQRELSATRSFAFHCFNVAKTKCGIEMIRNALSIRKTISVLLICAVKLTISVYYVVQSIKVYTICNTTQYAHEIEILLYFMFYITIVFCIIFYN